MGLISKIKYRARIKGFDVTINGDEVVISNLINKKYVKILPNGKIFSDDLKGHDRILKGFMSDNFLVRDPLSYSGSFICLPMEVCLHVGRETSRGDIILSENCLVQCFENIKKFRLVRDENLSPKECRIEHEFALSYRERQAFIKACLGYLIL